jgi:hypothetical protein
MRDEFESVYEKLAEWCRARDYAGHDPFDGLNSRLFQVAPFLRRSRLARLAWTQAFKRSPFNLRSLALVPAGTNPKGTALFALAALSRFRATASADEGGAARELLDALLDARIEMKSGGVAWGYNFDWQGRAFFAPRGVSAIVPTAFAVRALTEAVEIFERETGARGANEVAARNGAEDYLAAARGACEFILRDLNRSHETDAELCFSYTPLDRTRVFNASLLAAEALASVGALTGERGLLDGAARAARYVVRRRRADGSWAYGEDSYQSWADNFHTAFVLTSLARIRRHLAAAGMDDERAAGLHGETELATRRGFEFWRESFFLADGWPKYFPNRKYPADAHSAGACVVACAELASDEPRALELAERVAGWAVREMFDARGFFHYQRRRFLTVRTPYMRWSQAWMLYALARLLEMRADGHTA